MQARAGIEDAAEELVSKTELLVTIEYGRGRGSSKLLGMPKEKEEGDVIVVRSSILRGRTHRFV